MNEKTVLLEGLLSGWAEQRPLALMLVVAHTGSAPAAKASMMLIQAGVAVAGTIGGGALEFEAMAQARQAMLDGRPRLLDYVLTPEASGMPCGGGVTVLIAPMSRPSDVERAVFTRALQCLKRQTPVSLGICCHYGQEGLDPRGRGETVAIRIRPLQAIAWHLAAADAQDHPSDPGTFLLHLSPSPRLLVFGAGHIAQALAPMALAVDFQVTVLDDRAEYLTTLAFPEGVDTRILPAFEESLAAVAPDSATWLLIATYGHRHDHTMLTQALATPAAYIGVVGSRHKRASMFDALNRAGWGPGDLARVHCPVGLPIGGITPAEIAVSILAQMIAVRRGKA